METKSLYADFPLTEKVIWIYFLIKKKSVLNNSYSYLVFFNCLKLRFFLKKKRQMVTPPNHIDQDKLCTINSDIKG